jgi:hypothetical protein
MSVAYTSYHRSVPLDEASAKAIAAQTHLFGYQPDIIPLKGWWYLALCSASDDIALHGALKKRVLDLYRQTTEANPQAQPSLADLTVAAFQSMKRAERQPA